MAQSKLYLISDPAAVAAKIAAAGGPAIDLAQPNGKASADGVTIGWKVTAPTTPTGRTSVNVTIVSKPWIVPYGTIWEHVDAVLQG